MPVTSIDSAAITFGGGQPTGGTLDITVFSPSFGIPIFAHFDFDAGTFLADGGGLGFVSGTVEAQTVVPLPAAAWLFISALGGLVVAKRRQLKA